MGEENYNDRGETAYVSYGIHVGMYGHGSADVAANTATNLSGSL